MKKLLILFAATLAFASVRADSSDSYLYWMVDTGSSGITFSDVALFATSPDTFLQAVSAASGGTSIGGSYASLAGLSNPATMSYYVELYNASGDAIFQSEAFTYSSLANSIYTRTMASGATPYNMAVNLHPVPEPTSGMMFLVGAMLLGLKRKRG